jgi:CHASE2 domain-containing sensor protein
VSAYSQTRRRIGQATAIGAVAVLIGFAGWWFGVGERLSFDVSGVCAADTAPSNVVVLTLDEPSYQALGQHYGSIWDRSQHARLLRHLKRDGSGPVIFDVLFADESTNAIADADFASAIREHGQVVLAADVSETSGPGFVGGTVRRPFDPFLQAAIGWGVSEIKGDPDWGVRRHLADGELYKTLASAAAAASLSKEPDEEPVTSTERWLRYYTAVPWLSYYLAFDRAPGFFKDKIVLIGGKPRTVMHAEEADEFRTPFTSWTGESVGGVEIHATMLLNLLRGDSLVRLPTWLEGVLVVVVSLLIGFALRLFKPIPAALAGVGCAVAIAGGGVLLAAQASTWFPWVGLAGIVVPGAWLAALAAYKQELRAVRSESYPEDLAGPLPTATEGSPNVPGYALLRSIGRGAYGEVWLARNHIGTFNAVKLVYRSRLPEGRAYEREFRGIRKYTPVSLRHPGLVKILHVGRDDNAQYFHYVMELGDDEVTGQEINPESYQPRNLAKDLAKKGHLSVVECVAMGIALCEPLEFLHERKLMHRDIKPANIIFFDGIPKLADVGLVTEYTRNPGDMSYMGTEGYMAEPPTKPSADIYSLGKVLYEALTGLDRRQFPTLPDWITNSEDVAEFMALNSIILRCCDRNPSKRYQDAGELLKALLETERRFSKAVA